MYASYAYSGLIVETQEDSVNNGQNLSITARIDSVIDSWDGRFAHAETDENHELRTRKIEYPYPLRIQF